VDACCNDGACESASEVAAIPIAKDACADPCCASEVAAEPAAVEECADACCAVAR
jgi:hypothetical protein